MKRKQTLFAVCATVLAVIGVLAYQYQTAVLLAVVAYTSATEYEVGPPRELPWSAGPEMPRDDPSERPPNIILIVADDLGYNDISTFGGGLADGRVKTPHIDQLAADGVVFTQSYSGAGTCAPSRAMLMTGRYPTRTGFEFTPTPSGMAPMIRRIAAEMRRALPPSFYNAELDATKPPYEEQGLAPEEITIAEVLRDKGYKTFHIGKWHLGRKNGMAPHEQGFDQSLLMASALYLPEDDPNVVNAKLDFDPIDQFLWARLNFANSFNSGDEDRFEPGGYLTDYWTDESINIINANKHRPFFLLLGHWGVHTPLQATREDYEAVGDIQPHRKRVYAAMIRALDRSVGRINEALEAAGLADNTLVVFTNDNGGPGYIGLPDINKPFRGWKISQFEGGIRVPLMMKWPARIPAGSISEVPVTHIDMMPTLTAAAEAELPPEVVIDGKNLLPLATTRGDDKGYVEWSRDTLFWQSGHYRVVRHKDWKLQVADRPKKQWLFNLAVDPTEQNNLATQEPTKLAELLALLEAHAAAAVPHRYPPVTEFPIAIDKTLTEPFEDGDEYIYWPN